MKRIIITFLLVVSIAAGKTFAAGEVNVSVAAQKAFQQEFPGVVLAKWDRVEGADLYIVRFLYKEQGYVAYIQPEGNVLATARLISKDHLPYKVNRSVEHNFKDSEIVQVEELTMENTVSYFCTIRRKDRKIVLRVYNDGSFDRLSSWKIRNGF